MVITAACYTQRAWRRLEGARKPLRDRELAQDWAKTGYMGSGGRAYSLAMILWPGGYAPAIASSTPCGLPGCPLLCLSNLPYLPTPTVLVDESQHSIALGSLGTTNAPLVNWRLKPKGWPIAFP